jgi:hypothetical protein
MGRLRTTLLVAGISLVALLAGAPLALAASAVDQYSESIPAAGGQESSQHAAGGGGAGAGSATTIPPATQAQLEKSREGADAARVAQLTAPTAPGSASSGGGGETGGGGGLGLLFPLILAASLLAALGIVVARRGAPS